MKILVITHANSKKEYIAQDELGNLHVHVRQIPRGGKANEAVIEALAKFFHTKKSFVILKQGLKSKTKVFEILKHSKESIQE